MSSADAKPVIGQPVVTPTQPVAGKSFVVRFAVTRRDTGAPLTRGKMICDPSVSGRVIQHTESFRAGTARLAFVVPATATGKLLKVKVTIVSGRQSATKVVAFKVKAGAPPTLSIGSASVAEGASGTTTLSFPVSLSAAAAQAVSVAYATSDGTATAPSDYTAASGTLTFQPGEKVKSVSVAVVGDALMEQDETLTVTLTKPVNATIAQATATGTITNDDTAVPVTAGSYKGATQNGNYVFFTVQANRTLTGFRVNDLPETCDGPIRLTGGVDWTDNTFTIRDDASFAASGTWTGSEKNGDAEWTAWSAKLTGSFNGTTASGTIVVNDELNYKGRHYVCTTGTVSWSASLQP